MKTIYLLLTIFTQLYFCYNGSAQCFDFYRQTPKGSNVKACSGGGYSNWQVQQADVHSRTYAIEILEEGTDSYNCHAYAWHVSDGGDKVWISNLEYEPHNIDAYWIDKSYYQVNFITGETNLKVFYGSKSQESDHSAITTSDPDIFISKMGCGCLVRHYKNNSPYDNSNLTYYTYNNLSITGSSTVCSSNSTFTLSNVPEEATVNWSCSSNMQMIAETKDTCTVQTAISSAGENGTITATVSISQGSPITVEKNVWVGKPDFTLIGETQLEPKGPGIAFVNDINGNLIQPESIYNPQITAVDWSYNGPLDYLNGDTEKARYRAGIRGGYGTIYANATNQCGSLQNSLNYEVTDIFFGSTANLMEKPNFGPWTLLKISSICY